MNRKLSCLVLLCSISAAAQTTSKLAGNPPDAPSQVAFDLRLTQVASDSLPQAATPQAGSAQQGQAAISGLARKCCETRDQKEN